MMKYLDRIDITNDIRNNICMYIFAKTISALRPDRLYSSMI